MLKCALNFAAITPRYVPKKKKKKKKEIERKKENDELPRTGCENGTQIH